MGGMMLASLFRLCIRKKRARYQMSIKLPKQITSFIKNYVSRTFWNGTLMFFKQNYLVLATSALINHS